MQSRSNYTADLVIPCYNEEDALPEAIPLILEYMRARLDDRDLGISSFRLLQVDAGSHDKTRPKIEELCRGNTGIIPLIGFPICLVPYTRQARMAGETKYILVKMIRLAIAGITSFSVAPLRLIAALGVVVFVLSGLAGIYVFAERIFTPERVVPGWASTLLPLLLLGGMQILSIGVLGEYIGKIYMRERERPRFIVEKSELPRIPFSMQFSKTRERDIS